MQVCLIIIIIFFNIVLQLGKVILCSFSYLETASFKTYDTAVFFCFGISP